VARGRIAAALAATVAVVLVATPASPAKAPPASFQVGAAEVNITPAYYSHGAPFPSPVPPSCVAGTPPGTNPQKYFNGIRYFAFEDPYHVVPGSPPDEYDPSANGGAGEPFCKLDGKPFRVPEYGHHVVDPSKRYEGIYLAGGNGLNRTAKATIAGNPLQAQAIVFGRGSKRVALVELDSIGTFNADYQRIRDLVARQRPDLRRMQVVISSTHNESAPDSIGIWGATQLTTGVNHLYINWEVARVAQAIEHAADAMRPARLKIGEATDPNNFLPCFSSYPYLADRHIHVLQAVQSAAPHKAIATIMEYGIHDETLGFSGEPPSDLPVKGPDAANPEGYYRRVIAGDWGGFFRHDVEARLGGVAMNIAGPVGSVEMPVVFPAGTNVSRTPVVGPGQHAPATNGDSALGDCGRTAELPPHSSPVTIDQLTRARDIASFLAKDALRTLDHAPYASRTALSVASSPVITLSLRDNSAFNLAATFGLFPDRPVLKGPGGIFELRTQVSVIRLADAEMITLPGEMFPQATIRGYFGPADMAFPQEPITPWLATEMNAPHRFFLGLSQDMIGYLMPPGNFVGDCIQDDGMGHCTLTQAMDDPWHSWELVAANGANDRFGQHHSDDSESLGPVETQIAAATQRLLAATPDRSAVTRLGRYIDPNGTLDRSPLNGAVGVWVLPPGEHSFIPGHGAIYALPGRRLPRGVKAIGVALAPMDYNGLAQRAVADGTAGVLLGCLRPPVRLYVDVYPDLGGALTASHGGGTQVTQLRCVQVEPGLP
jgi:hypothetical protein